MLLTNVIQHVRNLAGTECSIAQAREYRKLLDCVECEWDEINFSSQNLWIILHIPSAEAIKD